MATFSPVITALIPDPLGRTGDEAAPLTPKPVTAPNPQVHQMSRDDATTPTRANFGALASQRPLPAATSFPPPTPPTKSEGSSNTLARGNSTYSAKSRDSQDDVEMGEDGQEGDEDDDDGSGEEIINADGTRSKKKGKSLRFYCTDYSPCTLSFTRSEHLARHIRKHTGERPFQCHCSRRFSRLDNLRQHAQTVHQNEDIPQDSLAATGTRFQRQVRTDRVRPPGSRARGSTVGSQTGSVRGHHRNSLSTSSIGSVGSAYSQGADIRRRPPPLVMTGDPNRNRYSQEYARPESPSQYAYRGQSPGGFSTPTSATFSTGQNSPRWTNETASPISSHSRTASLYGHRTPGRRLSVPSAGNPFQSPHGYVAGPPALGQLQHPNMNSFSPSSSMIGSPTTPSTSSTWSRRESMSGERSSDEAWRRRTWHPDSYSNQSAITSRLQQVTTPNNYAIGTPPPPQAILPSNAPRLENVRLPGIASFDPVRSSSPPLRREPSPMLIDTPSRAPQPDPYRTEYRGERRDSQQWDQGINHNFNQLHIQQGTPRDAASAWASETNRSMQAQADHARTQPAVRFEDSPYSARPQTSSGAYYPHHQSAPPITPRENKRMAWYHGPVSQQPIQRTSPADSSGSEGGIPGTPRNPTAVESNPGILHAGGYVERQFHPQQDSRYAYPPQMGQEGGYTYVPSQQTPTQAQHPQIPKPNMTEGSNISRLDALVAVATSEDSTAY